MVVVVKKYSTVSLSTAWTCIDRKLLLCFLALIHATPITSDVKILS